MTDWGSVPAWITAVGSLLAWGTAVIAARIAYRAWNLNRETARSAQAARVASWVEGHESMDLLIVNTSDLPVYDVHARVDGFGEFLARDLMRASIAVLPPGAIDRRPFPMDLAQRSRQVRSIHLEGKWRNGPWLYDQRISRSD